MLLLRYMAPTIPAALVVMAIATITIGLLGGEATGVQVAGHIPSGLPHLTLPNLDPKMLYELAPGALAIVLVGYAEALGAAKAAAIESGGDINPNQELVAHGLDLPELAGKMAESLVDLILLAPEAQQGQMLAEAISQLGNVFLEKSGAIEGEFDTEH